MKKLEFKIDIAADPKKVWDIMLSPETYKQWVSKSWPGSYFEGVWKKGESLRYNQVTCHFQGDYKGLNELAGKLLGVDLNEVKKW